MRDSTTTPCLLFPDVFDRPLTATFDVPNASSDGGAVLLKAADRRLGLIPRLAAVLVDERQPGKVRHALADLLGQRIHGLALGYEDANDAARLADDPMHKLLLGRDPITGDTLASTWPEFVAESGRPVIEKPFLPSEVRRIVAELAAHGKVASAD